MGTLWKLSPNPKSSVIKKRGFIMSFRNLQAMLLLFLFPAAAHAENVTGRVVFSGTAPAAQMINMKADPECTKLHSKAVPDEEQTVNANGTLKNVFVYVKQGLEGKTFDAPKEPVVLTQEGLRVTGPSVAVRTR